MAAPQESTASSHPPLSTSLVGKGAVVVGLGFSLVVCVLFVVEYVSQVIDMLDYMNTAHPHPTPVIAVFYGVATYFGFLAGIVALLINIPGLVMARGGWRRWARTGMWLGAALLCFQVLTLFAVFVVTGILS